MSATNKVQTFQCTEAGCTKTLKNKKSMESHIQKHGGGTDANVISSQANSVADKVQENILDEENEDVMDQEDDEWLFNTLDKMGEVYDLDNKEDEAKNLREKIERIKKVVKKKAEVIKDMKKDKVKLANVIKDIRKEKEKLTEKIDTLEAGASNCRECNLKDEVIRNKNAVIEKKEKEINAEGKRITELKKHTESQRKVVNDMKHNYEKAIEEANELRSKSEDQDDIIKHLKEQCGAEDDEEEVEEVPVARNLMNRNQSGHMCVVCNQRFVSNGGLEQHIKDKHTEFKCNYCEKDFRTKREMDVHMDHCAELGMAAVECDKCHKKLVRWGSKKHNCQVPQKQISCTVCQRIFSNRGELKKHIADEHREQSDKSSIVCRHYRNGNCYNGVSCEYSHVGHVKNTSQNNQNDKFIQKGTMCRHGEGCSWLAKGICGFFHRGVGIQQPRQKSSLQNQQQQQSIPSRQQSQQHPKHHNKENPSCPRGPTCIHLARGSCNFGGVFYHVQQQQQQTSIENDTPLCWEDANCKRIACRFRHLSLLDFPNLPKPGRPQRTRNQSLWRLQN